jgi:hypothetical protein
MRVVDVASQPSLEQPHTLIFFIATLVCLAFAVLPQLFLNRGRSWERRVFWGGTTAALPCVFVASLPDWKLGIGASLFGLAWMIFTAYWLGPSIKVGGKTYAFHVVDSLPDPAPDGTPRPGSDDLDYDPAPDSYGGLTTAKKSWWVMILTSAMCVLCVIIRADDKPWWLAPVMGTFFVILSAGFGYGDASWGYPVARGQRLQFVIIAIITAGAFTVLYLAGYSAGKRWPLRRKQSMEYRAHPRHQKNYP